MVDHVEILKSGVENWNKWRRENPTIQPELSDVDFGNLNMLNDFSGINLSRAYMSSCNLLACNFEDANLENAYMQNCNCYGASFPNANMKGANLTLVNFTQAYLANANLDRAYLANTIFSWCDLSTVKNLETCEHLHTSIIDHTTLAESDNLPRIFLEECGVPEFIIDNISSLKSKAVSFNSCFISYSSSDQTFATVLCNTLKQRGLNCWYAPEKLLAGRKTHDQIHRAIHLQDKLLVILSSTSMKSNWVATEIKKARERERTETRQILFPISIVPFSEIKKWELFDADLGQDLAAEIRSYHIPDFSDWENDVQFRKKLDDLLVALEKNHLNHKMLKT